MGVNRYLSTNEAQRNADAYRRAELAILIYKAGVASLINSNILSITDYILIGDLADEYEDELKHAEHRIKMEEK